MIEKFDVVIPALNEEKTVGDVVSALRRDERINNIILVDNGSSDLTGQIAKRAGAHVVIEPVRGLGAAVKRGLRFVETPFFLKTDADIDNWSVSWIDTICEHLGESVLIRAVFSSPYDQFPVTNLVVKPLLKQLRSGWGGVPNPITGTYMVRIDAFDFDQTSNDWAFDISLLVQCLENSKEFISVDIGELSDRQRDIAHYVPMADDIISYFLCKLQEDKA